ncbi:antiviral reverse transcriptase Drt3a [Halobacillus litoralis]|nr:antiviral reverse transcriptase Drt3a [Halobacillus litoralis]
MNITLDKNLLDTYFKLLKPSLKTGKDRVNVSNFERNIDQNLDIIERKTNNHTYQFTNFKKVTTNGRTVNIPTIRDRILIEYLKDTIKQKYKIKLKDRTTIISNLKDILSENIDYYIIRLDIENFFQSIHLNDLLSKIEKSSLLQYREYDLLQKLLSKQATGLPTGLSISNYLSELFLEGFDLRLRRIHANILFYSRYVDDIIIVVAGKVSKTETTKIHNKIESIFKEYKLKMNKSKSESKVLTKDKNSTAIEYLGYTFKRTRKNNTQKREPSLEIGISNDKLQKYTAKINYIFFDFFQNNNEHLLYERLKVLTKKNKMSKKLFAIETNSKFSLKYTSVTFGLSEDYKFINDASFKLVEKKLNQNIHLAKKNIHNRKMRRKLHKMGSINSNSGKINIIDKIPIHSLRSKVNKLDSSTNYSQILKMRKSELLHHYFRMIQ